MFSVDGGRGGVLVPLLSAGVSGEIMTASSVTESLLSATARGTCESSEAEDCDHRRTLSVTGAKTDESLVA